MGVKFYKVDPNNEAPDPFYHVAVPAPLPDEGDNEGLDVNTRTYLAAVAIVNAAFEAEVDAGSSTTLRDRTLGVNTHVDDDDHVGEGEERTLYRIGVYTAFFDDPEDAENPRPAGWPSVASDEALIDSVLEGMAPT